MKPTPELERAAKGLQRQDPLLTWDMALRRARSPTTYGLTIPKDAAARPRPSDSVSTKSPSKARSAPSSKRASRAERPSPAKPRARAEETKMPTKATKDEVMQLVEQRASKLRTALPALTHEQAVARVLEEDRELWRAYEAAAPHAPKVEATPSAHDPGTRKGAAWGLIQRKAAQLQQDDPMLTREAAVARACAASPELYAAYVRA